MNVPADVHHSHIQQTLYEECLDNSQESKFVRQEV